MSKFTSQTTDRYCAVRRWADTFRDVQLYTRTFINECTTARARESGMLSTKVEFTPSRTHQTQPATCSIRLDMLHYCSCISVCRPCHRSCAYGAYRALPGGEEAPSGLRLMCGKCDSRCAARSLLSSAQSRAKTVTTSKKHHNLPSDNFSAFLTPRNGRL